MRLNFMSVVLGLIIAGQQAIAAEKALPTIKEGEYITQADVEKGYKYRVKNLGVFTVSKLSVKDDPKAECLVSINGLKRATKETLSRNKEKVTKGVTVEVEMLKQICEWTGPNGKVKKLCCDNGGTGCKITIEVEGLMVESVGG